MAQAYVATRRIRDAPLSLFARERRYFQRAPRRDAGRRRGANGPLSVLFTDVHRDDSVNSRVNIVLTESPVPRISVEILN